MRRGENGEESLSSVWASVQKRERVHWIRSEQFQLHSENRDITISLSFPLSLSLNLPLYGDAYEQPHNFISFIKPTIKLNNAVINSN